MPLYTPVLHYESIKNVVIDILVLLVNDSF